MNTQEMLLTILAEECAETAQRASKAIRFGLDEIQEGQPLTNAERLVYEFNDIFALMKILTDQGFIKDPMDIKMLNLKEQKIIKYLEYSKQCGTLTD